MAYTPPGKTREQVYRYVRDCLLAGTPPTVRDVQRAMGFNAVRSAQDHLDALVSEGLLVKVTGEARGYRLPTGGASVAIPVLGRVQAGTLAMAIEEPDGYIAVQSSVPRDELFALRVRGESMTGVGIYPEDIVVVRRQPRAESGDIVVALVGDGATVKRLKVEGGVPVLIPENPAFEPVRPDSAQEMRLLGKVIEVRRYLEEPPLWLS